MARIGLDFGTTYSTLVDLSDIRVGDGGSISDYHMNVFDPGQGESSCIRSMVVKTANNQLLTGRKAMIARGKEGNVTYEAFKLMLPEENPSVLELYNYDSDTTPEKISRAYLDYILKRYTDAKNCNVEKLVVGVPVIWFDEPKTIIGRTKLKQILDEIQGVCEVELKSEPECACAYFVEEFRKKYKEKYNGNILLIDYGGGTLDVSLCEVKDMNTHSEITVLRHWGIGMSGRDQLGTAGFAYINGIVKEICLSKDPERFKDESVFKDYMQTADYLLAFDEVECNLKDPDIKKTIVSKFSTIRARKRITDICFSVLSMDCDVSYGMLDRVYESVIHDEFEKVLEEAKQYMEDNDIAYNDNEHFKIIPVGGFCNFFLTGDQIKKSFGDSAGDKRFEGMLFYRGEEDNNDISSEALLDVDQRERAIAYGAALIANDIVQIKQLAQYHLGIIAYYEGNRTFFPIIHKGDVIVSGQQIPLKGKVSGSNISEFAYSLNDDYEKDVYSAHPIDRYKESLKIDGNKQYRISLSLDSSMNITVWLQEIGGNREEIGFPKEIPLTDIHSLFGDGILMGGDFN